jgi:hypothetical protein
MKLASLLLLLAVLCPVSTRAQSDVYDVQARVSQTAVWVGDHFEYTVRVEHAPSIEFVLDHLKKEEMPMRPFELIGVRTATGPMAQGKRFFEVHLTLAIYEVAQADAAIPAFNLFYFRHGQNPGAARDQETTPAEVLSIPPFPMGVRNTVNDLGTGIRDQKNVLPLRRRAYLVPEVAGILGFLLVAAYLGWLAVSQIRSGFWKHQMAERARKKSLSESWEEIRQARVDSPEELAAFYKKASEVLRALATEKIGRGEGLTGPEIEAELRKAAGGSTGMLGRESATERQASVIGSLLGQCDLVRYTPDGLDVGRRNHAEFLRKFGELADHRN